MSELPRPVRLDFDADGLREYREFRDDMTEPVSYEQAGFTLDEIQRLNRRGIILHSVDKFAGQEDCEATLCLMFTPESPAGRLNSDLPNYDEEQAARIYWRFVIDAVYEVNDDTFKSNWIQYH